MRSHAALVFALAACMTASASAKIATTKILHQEAISPHERIRLCQRAASDHNLRAVKLDWTDVYAVVQAESDWVPRDGKGRNGKYSRGLAQLEDSTAKVLGLDASSATQSLSAVAILLKEAAVWSKARGHDPASGSLSVYYNLSTTARNSWGGSIDALPVETQRHIANFHNGKLIAVGLWREQLAHERLMSKRMAGYVTKMRISPP